MAETIPNDRRISLQEVCNYLGVKATRSCVGLISVVCPHQAKVGKPGVSKPLI